MNRRILTKYLYRKHQSFLDSITDDAVMSLVAKNSFITGGSIVSLLQNEPVKDFDYYFTNKETVLAVANYYVNKFNESISKKCAGSKARVFEHPDGRVELVFPDKLGFMSENGIRDLEEEQDDVEKEELVAPADDKGKYRPVFLSANAITLSNQVQLVLRFYGEPEEVHKNYDFIHCTCTYRPKEHSFGELVLPALALEAILTKQLYYTGSLYPICSVIRTRKFLKRGWHINAGQYLKMCLQISELNLKDIDVLREQLTGVDAAYFIQIINHCKEQQSTNPDFVISVNYLTDIVDRIFS